MFIELKYLKGSDKKGGEANAIVNINDVIAVEYFDSEHYKGLFEKEDWEREELPETSVLYYLTIYFRNERTISIVLQKSDCFRFISYLEEDK